MNKRVGFAFSILILMITVNACSVKKQAFTHVEIIRDSSFAKVDTSWKSKEVGFEIEEEERTETTDLVNSEDNFSRLIDSLFDEIDSNFNKEVVAKTIIQTKGLWNSDSSILETTLAKSLAVVSNGKLHHRLIQKDTTLKQKFDSLLMVISKEREIWHSREVKEREEKVSRSGINLKLIIIGGIILIIAFAGIRRLL